MNIDILKDEITTDPLARGYSGMSDVEVANDMNTVYRQRNKTSVTGTEILNAIDKAEFNTLSDANKQLVWNIIHLGTVNPFGLEADLFIDIFGGGSATITTLAGLRKENISRATELGISDVKEGNVWEARR